MMKMMIYFGHHGRSAEPAPVVQAGRRGRREVVWEMEVGMDLFFTIPPSPPREILSCKNRSTACKDSCTSPPALSNH